MIQFTLDLRLLLSTTQTLRDVHSLVALTSHWIVMIDVARSVSIAGNATLMMDSSMLAMLDARIVAISTQGLALAGRGTAADVDWIIASSQGVVLRDAIVA
jgi:hypothetical protein